MGSGQTVTPTAIAKDRVVSERIFFTLRSMGPKLSNISGTNGTVIPRNGISPQASSSG